MNEIIIFTDGSSRGNPGPGGWAAIIVQSSKFKVKSDISECHPRAGGDPDQVSGEIIELGGAEKNTTNNRMELTAVLESLSFISSYQLKAKSYKLTIYTDSSYVLNGATKWLKLWRSRGWKTMTKQNVLNRDLWEKLAGVLESKNISWKLLSGHVGIAGNERVDEIATDFADGKTVKLFKGKISDYKIKNILDINHDKLAEAAKTRSKSRSSAKAYSYLSMVNGVIETHKNWADCEKRVKGISGALFKKSISVEDEKQIIQEWQKRKQ